MSKESLNDRDLEDSKDKLDSKDSNELSESCDETSEDSTESSESKLDSKDLRIKELEEKYLRAYADFENTKKRMEREKYHSLEYANENILKDFLPILDTLESALNGIDSNLESSENVKNISKGIELTIDNFLKALNKHNVEIISTDCEFDPNVHNAIMQVKDEDKNDGDIAKVIQKGYKYKDRVIRPSMVAITKNN
ncbi:MAG: nucleotide exchange factor GrpE [Helicobacteraceae bacterium]|nr:nucleotide exchange factor GrpE [Helicobacteraceae bacterium]